MEWLYEALVNESRWIAPSIALAGILGLRALRASEGEADRRIAAGLSVYAGTMVGTMALGHLFAVSLKLAVEGLAGSLPVLLGIGIVLALASGLVARHGWALSRGDAETGPATVRLNLLLVLALLVTGPLNAPLAIPAALNAIHAGVRPRGVKRATVVVAVTFSVLLFVGSVRFFMSGQSFEEFSRIEGSTEVG